jgi:hypothetical protein
MKMKAKYLLLGILIIGILFTGVNYSYGFEEGSGDEGGDEIPDDDKDGVEDTYEDENKRDIEIWIGECVVEVASIRRSENKKDIIDLRVGYTDYGLSIRVSYGTFITHCEPPPEEEPPEEEPPDEPVPQGGDYCEQTIECKLVFEVLFRGLIEFIDLNDNGVLDEEHDEIISDYGFHSFQSIDYSLISISNDTNLHYLLFNSTDGIFAAHIYLVEEFVYVDETLISPTEVKIDIEITDYEYQAENSQLALMTKLWAEEIYKEREETVDEKEGYATDEKDVYVQNDKYSGFFSWKETALIDGVEMDVLTKELDFEDEHHQVLLICYARGSHIYHDPKIGIYVGISVEGNLPIIITTGAISVVAVSGIIVILLKKRRIL